MGTVQQGVITLLTLCGALGIFLYGMKLLSEGLQKVAGDRMRSLLAAMTSTRFKRILTGILVTATIQSSSATTVMVVSFVNAGLLSLVQAVGVIMGANIGTTVTAWIIALLGFKLDISAISLPLIGLSLPLLFSRRQGRRSIGELILGFSMIFLGLQFLKDGMPDLTQHPEVLQYLARFSNYGYGSILLFVLIGTILTVLVQSSSATVALTLIMCTNGWIDFPMAAAMVLGENIGTTITAVIAASVGNTSAKRAALFHLIFNLIGVFWILIVFNPFVRMVDYLTQLGGLESGTMNSENIPYALSLFHSAFNVTNTLLQVWFTPQLVTLVKRLLPQREKEDEEFRLRHIGIGLLQTGELSILQAKKETLAFARRTHRMFGFVRSMMETNNDKEIRKIYERIVKYETISDRVEVEIANYLSKINSSDLSEESGQLLQALFKIISDIESVADYCHNTGKILMRKHEERIFFNETITGNINHMMDLVDEAFGVMESNLSGDFNYVDLVRAYGCENRINLYRNNLKREHIQNVEQGVYSYAVGVIYSDIFSQCERMGDNLINISEDIAEIEHPVKGLESETLDTAMGN